MSIWERKVNVLGAGVSGLTTACLLQSQGFQVTVFCRSSPSCGEKDPLYTSPKAGAHWRSVASKDDHRCIEYDKLTFEFFRKLIDLNPDAAKKIGLFMVPSFEVFKEKPFKFEDPWFKDLVPNYQVLPESPLPGFQFGVSYDTMCIDVGNYLPWLEQQFIEMGGLVQYRDIQDIQELMDDVTLVVNCAGIQCMTLEGVQDKQCFPIRGQTVIAKAPLVNYTITCAENMNEFTYVIPRTDGTVVLGGTYIENEHNLTPDLETSVQIIERCKAICPELKEMEILHHKVGLRPGRVGGIRLEAETVMHAVEQRPIRVIHNYGHAGAGYQSSWGCSYAVLELCNKQQNLFEKFATTLNAKL